MNDENTSIVIPLDNMLFVLQTLADAFSLEPRNEEKISGKEVSEIILTTKIAIEKDFTEQWIATHQGRH